MNSYQRRRYKKHSVGLWVMGLIILFSVPISLRLGLAWALKEKVHGFLSKKTAMTTQLGAMKFGILPGVIKIYDMRLNNDKGLFIDIAYLEARVDWMSLFFNRLHFRSIACDQVAVVFNQALYDEPMHSSKERHVLDLLSDIMKLRQDHHLLALGYCDAFQTKNIRFTLRDYSTEKNTALSLQGDILGIHKMKLSSNSTVWQIESYGRGGDDLCESYQFSYFISDEDNQWGQLKVDKLNLAKVEDYFVLKPDVDVREGLVTSSLLLQKVKSNWRVQFFMDADKMKVQEKIASLSASRVEHYFRTHDGVMKAGYFIEGPSQRIWLADLRWLMDEIRSKLRHDMVKPLQDVAHKEHG